ncbi:hypothetical protein HYU17_03820 [Candidatus Woesearchaeota archaeon]|nr:hypothetical protein [Candidatus Woesearchaeota archaeon]
MDSAKHICSGCSREFQNAESMEQHRQAKHTAQPAATVKGKSRLSKKIIAAAIILLIIVGGYFIFAGKERNGEPPLTDGGSNGDDGFDEKAFAAKIPKGAIHWHPHVTLLIKGKQLTIPPNVGLESAAHKPVHTHEADNILHWEVSKPTVENMQLGYFFDKVWKKKFSSECILDSCNGPGGTVKMFVNGSPNSEFNHYLPRDGDEIRIVYE